MDLNHNGPQQPEGTDLVAAILFDCLLSTTIAELDHLPASSPISSARFLDQFSAAIERAIHTYKATVPTAEALRGRFHILARMVQMHQDNDDP